MTDQHSDEQENPNHIAFFYSDHDERMRMLSQYFAEGVDRSELCIFVTPDSRDEIFAAFERHGFAAGKAAGQGQLRIFEMVQTYLPHGKFVAEYMMANLGDFIENSAQYGYRGLRTAGEMSWLDDKPQFWDAASAYESKVNGLRNDTAGFTGLCLYPIDTASPEILKGAILTHPSVIYCGATLENPFYNNILNAQFASENKHDTLNSLLTVK